ncbi:hypothetical protein QUC31_019646, partial [Theobroma cacao]
LSLVSKDGYNFSITRTNKCKSCLCLQHLQVVAKRCSTCQAFPNYPDPPVNPTEDSTNFPDQLKVMSAALVKAAKQFDALVATLPSFEGVEEAQLRKIVEPQVDKVSTRITVFLFYMF